MSEVKEAIVLDLDVLADYKRRFLEVWRRGQKIAWELCDLCVEADRLGEEVYQILDELDIEYSQFRRWQRLGYLFPPKKRFLQLSISHHEEVVKLEPETAHAFLQLAVTHKWSKTELREKVKKAFQLQAQKPAPPPSTELTEEIKPYLHPKPHVQAIVLTQDGRIEYRDSRVVNMHEYFISSAVANIFRYAARFKEEECKIIGEIITRLETYIKTAQNETQRGE